MTHKKITAILIVTVIAMICFAYGSVPLYRIFCKVTGYGGTVRRFDADQKLVPGQKFIEVRFNADINPNLEWSFKPEVTSVKVKTGVNKLVFYTAENLTNRSLDGMAVYNVTPHKAGKYFNKIACFCFSKQTLLPNQKVVMPVSFFIDPAIEDDEDTREIESLTLSYTFFEYRD